MLYVAKWARLEHAAARHAGEPGLARKIVTPCAHLPPATGLLYQLQKHWSALSGMFMSFDTAQNSLKICEDRLTQQAEAKTAPTVAGSLLFHCSQPVVPGWPARAA